MKNLIGLIVALIIIILSIIIFNGTVRYIGSFVGVMIGIITSILLHGFATQKYISSIIIVILIAIIGIIFLFVIDISFVLDDLHDYFAIEHSLDLQLHESYTIDTSGIKKYTKTKENAFFTFNL